MEKRSKLEIVNDILELLTVPMRKTHIVYKANLNFDVVNRYIKYMMDRDLIIKDGDYYERTQIGEVYILTFSTLEQLVIL